MPWPVDNLETGHLDAATDNPGLARVAILRCVQVVKDLLGRRATQAEAEAGAVDDKLMTPQRARQALAASGTQIRDALAALAGANRLSASAIKDLPAGGSGLTPAQSNKLAAIEVGATADQTAAEIKAALETLAGANRLSASAIKDLPAGGSGLTPAQSNKLAAIEVGATADQTAAEIKAALETLAGANRLSSSAIKDLPSTLNHVSTTQSAYDGLTSKASNTLYLIPEDAG